MSGIGVMICGHGSRDEAACDEFRRVVDRIAERLPEWPVEMGYLEFARPIIRDGLDALRARGVDHVLAVPGMLFAAGHVKNDVPSVLNAYAAEHGLRLEMGRDLGIDAQAAGGRARPDRRGAAARRERRPARRDLPRRDRPRHLRQRRQRQRRQGGADAVGGHGLRARRDRLLRRRAPAHRGGARARDPAGLPADRRVPLLPVHRRAGAADLRGGRRGGGAPPGDRVPEGRTTSTTIRW